MRSACALQAVMLALSCIAGTTVAAERIDEFKRLSLEDLMDIQVTSVSRRPEKRSEAAAAVYVITPEKMRRWGVTSVPDALRMVPGLQVARIDANKWAITARGFNSRFANKLLVMIDGRSVYTPLFAGVYWDMNAPPLQDIERIEVIRGPGGSLWGANAVNGVINIITKSSGDTQGGALALTTGTEDRALATLRYGAALSPQAQYRVYAQHRYTEGGEAADANDDWRLNQIGFRGDWAQDRDQVTMQGDAYRGTSGQRVTVPTDPPPAQATLTDDVDLQGANLLARWQRSGDGTTSTVQAYLDHVERDGRVLYEDRTIFDIELQQDTALTELQRLSWGLGYRQTYDDTRCNDVFCLDPDARTVHLFSTFGQIEMALVPDELIFTLGTKLEHNDFSGFEYQPNVRLAWLPDDSHTFWTAVSRAVRTPSRGEHDVQLRVLPGGPPDDVPWVLQGNADFDSERLLAYEAGYRWHGDSRFSIDLAAFYNDYDRLRSLDPDNPPPPVLGFPFGNEFAGETYGLEATADWQVLDDWQLSGGYSYLAADFHRAGGGSDRQSNALEDVNPRHQANLTSSVELGPSVEWNTVLRYVDSVRVNSVKVPAYLELDTRVGWRIGRDLRVAIVGRNLLDDSHPEFEPDFIQTQGTEVERSVHLDLQWRF